jgi:phosphoenolpyruvate---glycerone phosphotransferase subunit DhaL
LEGEVILSIYAEDVKYIISKIANVIEQNKELLTELDSAIGDADHGINMSKGYHVTLTKLQNIDTEDIGDILKAVGMTLVSNVGGASGPLYGTAYLRAGAAVKGKKEVNIKDFADIMDAAIEGIKMRGKAELGDKTMLDAIMPAAAAIHDSINSDLDTLIILEKARDAALQGVEGTVAIEAKKGRASYLGARSIGHKDPGAMSSYLTLNCIYEAIKELYTKN